MYYPVQVVENLYWVGGNDRRLSLFESAYPVPKGISYNAYLLLEEKTVLFDTVDNAVADAFFEGVESLLGERRLNYLVVHHVEPDHSATLKRVIETFPDVTVVANAKTVQMMSQYLGFAPQNVLTVKEGDTLAVGSRTLRFIFAPMVHWPEVMFTYEERAGILFSADAFGAFGALGGSIFADKSHFERDYLSEARRYYTNIVGKYGVQVQAVLKKVSSLKINYLCPLHGPVWRENIGYFIEKYLLWSGYQAEDKGVAIFYASVYGHTQNVAETLASMLSERGIDEVKVYDVSATDVSELLSESFRLSHLVFASTTYNNGIFVNMERFLSELKAHAFKNRKYALIENGTWAPQAGKLMEAELSALPNVVKIGDTVKVLSSPNLDTVTSLSGLAEEIIKDFNNN